MLNRKALLTKTRTLLFLFFCLSSQMAFGQLPPFQPEQDCINALPVCQSIFVQPNSYVGEGVNPNEISNSISCLTTGEKNDVWYIFTVQVAGLLSFTITPATLTNDYDWAVYNLTNAPCSDIATDPSLSVSCNYSGTLGVTGAFAPGTLNTQGAGGSPTNAPIPVAVGDIYVLNVSNFSSTNNGYTLDFSNSTASIFDNIPPEVDSIQNDCSGNLNIYFSESVVCSSVDASDFTLTGPGGPFTITAATGTNCTAGATYDHFFNLSVSPPINISGTYYVSLVDTVFDNCGNVGIYSTDSVQLYFPTIVVSATQDTMCVGDSITLTTPNIPNFTHFWSTGIFDTLDIVSPDSTTTYYAFAQAPNGCYFSGSYVITVIPTPTADFIAVPDQFCMDDTTTLTYTGTSLPIANFTWDFVGGNILSGTSSGPYDVQWSTPGIKNATLSVEQLGCLSQPVTVPITVFDIPNANFSLDTDVCLNGTANCFYAGNATSAASYTWDFDGGIVMNGSGAGPYQVEWATPGMKSVCLFVEENGCVSTFDCQSIMVNAPPIAAIAPVVDQCLKGNTYTFNYSGPSNIAGYDWDLGEPGSASTLTTPIYSYTNFGPKTVTLTITDVNNCVSQVSTNLEVFPPVTADFSYTPVCAGLSTPFTDQSSSNPTGPIQIWDWEFGDGSTTDIQTPSHLYGAYGDYPVTLIITSIHGCKDTISQSISVYDQPEADFTFINACDNESVTFSNSSLFNNPDVTYEWTFGDTESSIQESPDHLYNTYGPYSVSMTITTNEGCTDTKIQEAEVYPLPTAEFQADPVCHLQKVVFVNQSTVPAPGEVSAYRWDLGDGIVLNGAISQYEYSQPQFYQAELLVETIHGCLDSITKEITVYPLPTIDFFRENVCEDLPARIKNKSSLIDTITETIIQDWIWDFGDGTSAGSLIDLEHVYTEPGTYGLNLTVISDVGCQQSLTRPIVIHPNPQVPAITDDTLCFSDQAFLLAAAPSNVEVEWFYNLTDDRPFHKDYSYVTPPNPYSTTYYVEAVSEFTCRSGKAPIQAVVFEPEAAILQMSDSIVETPNAVVNFRLSGTFVPDSYQWNFGDGTSSTADYPSHQYEHPGIYQVTLQAITPQGCEVELNRLVEVKEVIEVYIPSAFSPNDDGINDEFYMSTRLMTKVSISIFNRWGQMVFESVQPDFRWNGFTPDGTKVNEGVYVYRFQGQDIHGKTIKQSGTITVLK